jgi:hypothetical protein
VGIHRQNGKGGRRDEVGRRLPFSGGLAAVNRGKFQTPIPTSRGKWGFVDPSGKVAIEPAFDFVSKFTEDGAGGAGQKWGYIDRHGKFVIPPRFDEAKEFDGGLARVKLGTKIGYIDRTGGTSGSRPSDPADSPRRHPVLARRAALSSSTRKERERLPLPL